jgi:dephospho-CoA kinase
MALIFVTGISTSGKSTIVKELVTRGYEAYDTEHNGHSAWFNKKTGKVVAVFGQVPERTQQWLDQHEWNIDAEWVKQMAAKAKNKTIFLCGGAHNKLEVRQLCDKVIWLKVDEKTIRKRVNIPRDHDFGTKEHELIGTIKWNKINEKEFQSYGAIMIDATQPLNKVVDKILSIC